MIERHQHPIVLVGQSNPRDKFALILGYGSNAYVPITAAARLAYAATRPTGSDPNGWSSLDHLLSSDAQPMQADLRHIARIQGCGDQADGDGYRLLIAGLHQRLRESMPGMLVAGFDHAATLAPYRKQRPDTIFTVVNVHEDLAWLRQGGYHPLVVECLEDPTEETTPEPASGPSRPRWPSPDLVVAVKPPRAPGSCGELPGAAAGYFAEAWLRAQVARIHEAVRRRASGQAAA